MLSALFASYFMVFKIKTLRDRSAFKIILDLLSTNTILGVREENPKYVKKYIKTLGRLKFHVWGAIVLWEFLQKKFENDPFHKILYT